MLTKEVEFWCIDKKQMMKDKGANVTWESVKLRYMEEYFPNSVRHVKEIEFMQLEQGNLLVTEICYQVQTLSYILYPSHNLRFGDAKEVVIPFFIRKFLALMDNAKMVESL